MGNPADVTDTTVNHPEGVSAAHIDGMEQNSAVARRLTIVPAPTTPFLIHPESFQLGLASAAKQLAALREENARLTAALGIARGAALRVTTDGCVALSRI